MFFCFVLKTLQLLKLPLMKEYMYDAVPKELSKISISKIQDASQPF